MDIVCPRSYMPQFLLPLAQNYDQVPDWFRWTFGVESHQNAQKIVKVQIYLIRVLHIFQLPPTPVWNRISLKQNFLRHFKSSLNYIRIYVCVYEKTCVVNEADFPIFKMVSIFAGTVSVSHFCERLILIDPCISSGCDQVRNC